MSGNEDIELKMIQLKRLRRIMEHASKAPQEKAAKDPMEKLRPYLGDRAEEVLNAALEQYPEHARLFISKLVELAERGMVNEKLDGGTLYQILKRLGMKVRLETEIVYYKEGEYRRLSDMIKMD